jgi:hypothetical protein
MSKLFNVIGEDEDEEHIETTEEQPVTEIDADIFDEVEEEVITLSNEDKQYIRKMNKRYELLADIRLYTLNDFMKIPKARKILERTWSNKFNRFCSENIEDTLNDYFEDSKERYLNVFELVENDYVFSRFKEIFCDIVRFHVRRKYDPAIFYYRPRLALGFIQKLERNKYYETKQETKKKLKQIEKSTRLYDWGNRSYAE